MKRFSITVILIFQFSLVLVYASTDNPGIEMADEYSSFGSKLIDIDNERALGYFNKALQINPNSANTYYLRGVVELIEGQWELAVKDFLRITQLKPDSADAYFCLGNLYIMIPVPNYSEAIRQFDKAISLDPKYFQAYINKAISLYRSVEATIDKETATKMAIESKLPKEARAPLKEALKLLDKAIKLNPGLFSAHFNKGVIAIFMFKEKEAISALTKATKIGLDYQPFQSTSLSIESEKEGQYLAGNEPICIISGLWIFLLENHSSVILEDGQKLQEIGIALKYISGKKDALAFAFYHRGLAYAHAKMKNYKKAISDFNEAIKLNPNVHNFYFFRSMAFMGNGQTAEALTDLKISGEIVNKLVTQILTQKRGPSQKTLIGKTSVELIELWGKPTASSWSTGRGGVKQEVWTYHFPKVGRRKILHKHVKTGTDESGKLSITYSPYDPEVLENYWVFNAYIKNDRVTKLDLVNKAGSVDFSPPEL